MDSKSKGKEKAKMGRPPTVVIDEKQAYELGSIDCTFEECSRITGIAKSTLSMREDFVDAYKKGQANLKRSLRRMLIEKAKEGNVVAMIFLSKNLLGYKDNPEIVTEEDGFELIDKWGQAKWS